MTRGKQIGTALIAAALMALGVFLVYTGQYYRADETAIASLKSDEAVSVIQMDYGWLFDGPSETDGLIFYPGGKVEETAYAPLLHHLAGEGMDVCLVKMPFRLAVLDMDKADRVMTQHAYRHWYIGGHSLGGAMAALYAAGHSTQLDGVIMLAAYPTKTLDADLGAVIIYGSEDGVLNRKGLEEADRYLPDGGRQYVIAGGNHAQFGNYGIQQGDGTAVISAGEQQRRTVELIRQSCLSSGRI